MTDAIRDDAFKRASELLGKAQASPAAPEPSYAWHEHGAFCDIEEALRQISRARDAMAGIATLMQPGSGDGNEQLNMARRGDVSAVFEFFADAMQAPLEAVDGAVHRLSCALRTGQP